MTASGRAVLAIAVSAVMISVVVRATGSGVALAQTEMSVAVGAKKDNTLYEDTDNFRSNGKGGHFFAGRTGTNPGGGRRRGLLSFNIAGNIPGGATIKSVSLTLSMSKTTAASQSITLHRLLSDWGEGSSNAPE